MSLEKLLPLKNDQIETFAANGWLAFSCQSLINDSGRLLADIFELSNNVGLLVSKSSQKVEEIIHRAEV